MSITPSFLSLGGLATGSTADTESAKENLTQSYDQFLTLLTTQLQNQDPLDPMDSSEFTNQLVQFAAVEQQIAQTERLESILGTNQAFAVNAATSFIDKKVQYEGQDFIYDGTPQDMSYFLEKDAIQSKITVLDENNQVVWSTDGQIQAGEHQITWDGLDNFDQPLPEGRYSFQVGAQDAEGEAVQTSSLVSGNITGIEVIDGTIMLRIEELLVGIDQVLSVKS